MSINYIHYRGPKPRFKQPEVSGTSGNIRDRKLIVTLDLIKLHLTYYHERIYKQVVRWSFDLQKTSP